VEFIGTLLFVTAIFGAILTRSPLAPLGIGAALMALVYAGGHISGAHYNPAVSVAVAVRGRLPLADLLPYIAAQLLGAGVAYLISLALYGDQLDTVAGGLDLTGRVLPALIGELVFTFALGWVVLNVATSDDHPVNSFYGLAIGFTVTAGAIAVGNISGSAFNPAVTVALMAASLFAWKWIWLYLLAQFAGGALAGLAFRYVEADDSRVEDDPEDDLRRQRSGYDDASGAAHRADPQQT
jgi:aquaporin Z